MSALITTTRQFSVLGAAAMMWLLMGVVYIKSTYSNSNRCQISSSAVDVSKAVRASDMVAPSAPCTLVGSVEYQSSDLEKAWLQNAAQWADDYCNMAGGSTLQAYKGVWLETMARIDVGQLSNQPYDSSVFSRFTMKYMCGQDARTITTWIEPLSFGLRHPDNHCGNERALFNMSYLLLAHQDEVSALRSFGPVSCINRACQNIYMDLGATTWSNNDLEAGQGWFVRHYAKRNITFDRLLLWEAKPISPPTGVYDSLPLDLLHKYQYFNMPATSDLKLQSHPLNVLKRVAQPGDFVVLKLDIDNAEVEESILRAFLQDPIAFALVDEFFFEHHVDFPPMRRYWGGAINSSLKLDDSYKLFLQLRQQGWRAHSWV